MYDQNRKAAYVFNVITYVWEQRHKNSQASFGKKSVQIWKWGYFSARYMGEMTQN